ncbi:hypothetical protein Tco_0510947 [Tanacetum coccineum]
MESSHDVLHSIKQKTHHNLRRISIKEENNQDQDDGVTLEQERLDLDVENKQKKDLKASYGVTTPQDGYDAIYGKKEHGMLEQWMCFRDNERQSVRGNLLKEWVLYSFDVEMDYGKTRNDPYSRRFGEYKKVFDKEIEQLANEYDLRIWKKRYSFEGGRSFVCITKQLNDALPLGRANESRFMGMVRKEMNEEEGSNSKEMEFEVTSPCNCVVKLLLSTAITTGLRVAQDSLVKSSSLAIIIRSIEQCSRESLVHARVKELSNHMCLVHGFGRACVVLSPFMDQWINTNIRARDAGFGRRKQEKEGSQGQLQRNHPAGVTP